MHLGLNFVNLKRTSGDFLEGHSHTCIKKSMPTAIVVPSAKPKAKSVAAKAGTLKGIMG